MKRSLAATLALILCFASALVAYAAKPNPTSQTIQLVIAHEPPSPYYVEAVKRFAKDVEKQTQGRIKVKVSTSREFGACDQMELVQNLQAGKIQMSAASVSVLGDLEEKFWVFEMPFLFRDYAHVAKTIDGPVGQRISQGLLDDNLRNLAFTYSGGFKVTPTNSKPIRKPSDFKGLRIRTPGNPVSEATYEAWGAVSVPARLQDIETLAKAGKIDGSEMTYSRYFEHHLSGSVLNETHHSFFLTALMINEKFYQGLNPKDQEIIRKAAHKAALYERQRTIEEIEVVRADCKRKGVKIVTLTPQEMKAFRDSVADVYAEFTPMMGKDLLTEIANLR